MGAVNFSIDTHLIDLFLKKLPLTVFIETGTFKGDTVAKLLHQFKSIYSIELSKEYFEMAKTRFNNDTHVTLINDDSATSLSGLQEKFHNQATVFWLDAHWCVAENTAGQLSQCPLLKEIEAIKVLNNDSVVIIDDARLFMSAPPSPHEITDWPNFSSIILALQKLSLEHNLIVLNDSIIYFPKRLQQDLTQYAYTHGIDWLNILDKSRDYDKLLTQLHEKDKEIQNLLQACEDRRIALETSTKYYEEKLSAVNNHASISNKYTTAYKEFIAKFKSKVST